MNLCAAFFAVIVLVCDTILVDAENDLTLTITADGAADDDRNGVGVVADEILDINDVMDYNNSNDEWSSLLSDDGNVTISSEEVGSNLLDLLEAYDLRLESLATMFTGTYFPDNPRDSDTGCARPGYCESMPTFWKSEVVTPVNQGVNGSLVQAVLFTNGHRNPENPQRVLSFAGAMLWGSGVEPEETAMPESTCLAAAYQFKNTEAEPAWQHLCLENGYVVPDMPEWEAQIRALVEETKPTFLTGHKMGCDIAKTVGILNPDLPVVCWSATGTLNQAWIDAYPGLADALESGNRTNDNMYVMQINMDAHSMCLLPKPSPGSGVANVCVYGNKDRCADNKYPFDWDPTSMCSLSTSGTLGLLRGIWDINFEEACIAKEYVGSDFRLRYCPHENYTQAPTEEGNTTSSSNLGIGHSFVVSHRRFSATFLLLAALELFFAFS